MEDMKDTRDVTEDDFSLRLCAELFPEGQLFYGLPHNEEQKLLRMVLIPEHWDRDLNAIRHSVTNLRGKFEWLVYAGATWPTAYGLNADGRAEPKHWQDLLEQIETSVSYLRLTTNAMLDEMAQRKHIND